MPDIAVRVEGLGKLYRIGATQRGYKTLREKVNDLALLPFRTAGSSRNGHAQLSRSGTGFHPELTGRENIFLNGAILGMRRAEIVRKFDEIVAFAEIERFLDTPVKHYSSGMYMRLAFAVAAHLDPEILVVDEVLAVGDAAFQKKCLGKIGEVARQGRTVLFVSHNMTAVQSLCDRAIWLHAGRIVEDGKVRQVASNYMQAGVGSILEQTWDDPESAPGNEYVRLRHIRASSAENASQEITVRTPIRLEIEFWNNLPNARLNLSMSLFRIGENVIINTCASVDHECDLEDGVHVSPGAHLAGRVVVGRAAWIGIGAVVADRVHIGAGAMIGAGAVVINDIPDHVVAYGVPAKVIRKRMSNES